MERLLDANTKQLIRDLREANTERRTEKPPDTISEASRGANRG